MRAIKVFGVMSTVAFLGSVTLGSGCSSTSGGGAGTTDSGVIRTGSGDTGTGGLGTTDSGTIVLGTTDSGTVDTGMTVIGMTDAGMTDSHTNPVTDATTDGSKDAGETGADTGVDGDATGGEDAGDSGDSGLIECLPPASTTGFKAPTYVPSVAHQGACSATKITSFITACGYDNGSQTACTAWQEANVDGDGGAGTSCGNCIMAPMQNGGTWLPAGMTNAFATLPNYAGCIQLSDSMNGTACASALNTAQACDDLACAQACMNTTDPSGFGNCVMDATGCTSYSTSEMSACAKDFAPDGGGVGNTTCEPSLSSGDMDDDFTYILTLICAGAGPGDAGDQ